MDTTQAWSIITFFGNTSTIIVLCIVGFFVVVVHKRYRIEYSAVLISSLVSGLIVQVLKETFKVPRPTDALIELGSYSFPSGHSSIAFAFYFLIWLLVRKSVPWYGHLILLGLTVLIPLSRLALHVHRPFEVIAGSILGLVIASAVYVIFFMYTQRQKS